MRSVKYKVQLEDDIVGKVFRWLELGGEPQREELLLVDPVVKYFWRFKENLAIRGGVLKYKWMSGIDRWLLVVPEILKRTVLEFCHSSRYGWVTWGLRKLNLEFWKGPSGII